MNNFPPEPTALDFLIQDYKINPTIPNVIPILTLLISNYNIPAEFGIGESLLENFRLVISSHGERGNFYSAEETLPHLKRFFENSSNPGFPEAWECIKQAYQVSLYFHNINEALVAAVNEITAGFFERSSDKSGLDTLKQRRRDLLAFINELAQMIWNSKTYNISAGKLYSDLKILILSAYDKRTDSISLSYQIQYIKDQVGGSSLDSDTSNGGSDYHTNESDDIPDGLA